MKLHNLFIIIFSCSILSLASCSYEPTFDFTSLKQECDSKGISLYNDNSYIIVMPKDTTSTGIVYYPGALVSYESYLPLMIKIAEEGIACVLVQMPSDFAFTNMNAALRVVNRYDDIKSWYISGHSLGGAMAASFIASNASDFKGIIFMASYSTSDLNNLGLRALSIYGSNDQVLNTASYSKYRPNLPGTIVSQSIDYNQSESYTFSFDANTESAELIITGGNHAGFASYGKQKGDGDATISNDSQHIITAKAIKAFIGL